MECSPKSTFGLFGSLYFAGVVASSLIIPRLSDIYGRRKFFIFGISLHILTAFILLISRSLELSLIMIFFQGIAMTARAFVGFAWFTENLPVKSSAKVTSIMFGVDGLCIFMAAIWFKYISKEWTGFYVIPLSLFCLIWIWNLFQKETPKYYYSKGDYD